jgi:hypothetical protein
MSPSKQASLGLRVSGVVFALVSIAHLARLWSGVELQIGAYRVGFNVSAAAIFISAALGLWLWKLAVCLDRSAAPPVHRGDLTGANPTGGVFPG